MQEKRVLKEFADAGALLEGHFVLSSGLHSSRYLQCARALMDAKRAARLCKALAARVREDCAKPIDLVVSPAMGGVIVGYEMGRQLGVPSIFLERVDGEFTLRRGFDIPKGTKCLMVEDIVTTGLSSREAITAIRAAGGTVVGAACLIDRSNGKSKVGVKLSALAKLSIPAYEADKLPDDLAALPAIKPGSRGLK
ncbi:MAG: orotate phosphoribosyltransferase [Alphaproteobacteria bacterium]|nr:orotate phosphoribosyltransferase [Rhodobiaceae bacterium]MBO6542426.1 orotate phosphoribosyltransferase [Alphaproteobacteria bacterium]MBO6628956.1 orotate phosphoribosyltransferase [Alphaproteobacteria bacterium]MDF1624787.1 orotate phosphoribosyltransferase [Parvibaculaceae bacterium]